MNTNVQVIQSLDLVNLKKYLVSKGWVNDNNLGNLASIWHREENQLDDFELILPNTNSVKDFRQRIIDVFNVLMDFENRQLEEILNEVNNFHSDLIKIRVVHEDVEDGNIPIDDGIQLFENAKNLILSVIRSTYEKRKYFSGGNLTEEVSSYLKNVRLGQTEHGSYVVNIIAPIYFTDSNQEDVIKKSVTRLVSETLTKSLTSLDSVILEFKNTSRNDIIDKSVEKGVSANLCDALIGLSGKSKSRDVSISVSMSSIEANNEDLQFEYNFSSNNVQYLQKASDYFKGGNLIIKDKTISGYVIKLMHKEETEFGEIEIETKIDNFDKKVKLELPNSKYWEAHSAHKERLCVICKGDLIISPRSSKLINLSEFKVVKIDDVFGEN